MKTTLNPQLRSALSQAAESIERALASARLVGAAYMNLLTQSEEIKSKVTAVAKNPGRTDAAKIFLDWEQAVAEAEPIEQKHRLMAAVEATQTLQAKVFTMTHDQVRADVRNRLQDFFSPGRLEALEMTEVEENIGSLRMRLSQPPAQRTFIAVLRWAEFTQRVLADLAADKLEFTVQKQEVTKAV